MEKIKLSDTSEEDYLEYRVIHEDGSEGGASLRLSDLDDTHTMGYQVRGENLPKWARVAELFLYPHSKSSTERNGVGSRVLDYVLKDAAERNIKLVFAECTTLAARSFFQKRGFKGDYAPHCYTLV